VCVCVCVCVCADSQRATGNGRHEEGAGESGVMRCTLRNAQGAEAHA